MILTWIIWRMENSLHAEAKNKLRRLNQPGPKFGLKSGFNQNAQHCSNLIKNGYKSIANGLRSIGNYKID